MKTIHNLAMFAVLAVTFAAGCLAGHYHGKAETLERFTTAATQLMKGE